MKAMKRQDVKGGPPNGLKSGLTRKPVETLIASDSSHILKTLEHVLEEGRIFRVMAVATDGCEALRLAFTRQPELILMSDWMSHMDGIEATHYIKQLRTPPVVIIVASDDNPIAKARAAAAGADGFVSASGQLDNDLRKLLRERFRFKRKEP